VKDFPAARWLLRLLVNPGWAPMGVVVIHLAFVELGLSHGYDALLHFLGGASMAYFLMGLMTRLPGPWTHGYRWPQRLLAFTSSCTIAVFWEFAEFALDRFHGTATQQGLSETMLDLMFGVAGAFSSLLMIMAFDRFNGGRGRT